MSSRDDATARLYQPYLDAQIAGDRARALHVVLEDGVKQGVPVADIHLGVIQPAQEEIGRRWQLNEITVAQEHLATAISQLAVSHLYGHLERTESNGKLVVVACAEGEQHELGARLAADFLEMAGFVVRYLGASVPADSLAKMVVTSKASAVVLSAATSLCFPGLRAAVKAVRAAAPAVPILVGGAAFVRSDRCEGIADDVLFAGRTAEDLVTAVREQTGLAA